MVDGPLHDIVRGEWIPQGRDLLLGIVCLQLRPFGLLQHDNLLGLGGTCSAMRRSSSRLLRSRDSTRASENRCLA